jgi:hypothetical protein
MKRMLQSLMVIAALALLVVTGLVRDAGAEVRVSATLRTPNVSVRIGNVPPGPHGRIRVRHLPARPRRQYRIVKRDRRIARRLARYTGVPVRELIRLRAYGYNWYEIGHWLRLPRRVVRAAFDKHSWKRFIHGGRRLAGHGKCGYGHGEVVVYDY